MDGVICTARFCPVLKTFLLPLFIGKKYSMMGGLDYCSWVTKPAKIPPEMVSVYERYLLGSLATDASLMGHDCVRVLSLKNSSIAKGYLARLEEIGLAPDFVDSSEEVGSYIQNIDGMPRQRWLMKWNL